MLRVAPPTIDWLLKNFLHVAKRDASVRAPEVTGRIWHGVDPPSIEVRLTDHCRMQFATTPVTPPGFRRAWRLAIPIAYRKQSCPSVALGSARMPDGLCRRTTWTSSTTLTPRTGPGHPARNRASTHGLFQRSPAVIKSPGRDRHRH